MIEALVPLRLKFKNGETQGVGAGETVNLSDEHARKLLSKAVSKVRLVKAEKPDWLKAWRELADLTANLQNNDRRFCAALQALEQCDQAFGRDNWPAFRQAAECVRQAVNEGQR